MNDAAVTGPPARVLRGQFYNRIEMNRRITRETAKTEATVPRSWWPAEQQRQGPVLAQYTLRCGLGTGLASRENDSVGIPEPSSLFCPDFSLRTSAPYSSHSENQGVIRQY